MHETKTQSFLKGAAILAAASMFARIIGVIFKIPIARMLGSEGTGYFQVTYNIYALVLAISTAGIPVALSRMIASAHAEGNTNLAKRYYSVAMPAFMIIGSVAMLVMIIFAESIAGFMNSSQVAFSIRIIAPAVFFVCMISVYRGYAQGFGNMVPTALSQVVEVVAKTVIGITAVIIFIQLGFNIYIISGGAIIGVTVGAGLCIPLLFWQKKKIDRSITYSSPSDAPALPTRTSAFLQIMKVSIPITLTASFISIMTLVDTTIVLGRLQSSLLLTEAEAALQFGLFAQALMVFNLPPSFILPISVSIIPAIASSLAKKRREDASIIMQSAMKLTNLIAMPAAAGLMVLAGPILNVLFSGSSQTPENFRTMTMIMTILGATSYFVCLHHLNTAILQANGRERTSLITFPIGAILRIIISFILVAHPNIGVIGSAIGALVCFFTISVLNLSVIIFKIKEVPKFMSVFIKPFICTLIMAVATFFSHKLISDIGNETLGEGYLASALYLAVAIIVGIALYAFLIIITKTITKQDLLHLPKGEKIARFLKVRSI